MQSTIDTNEKYSVEAYLELEKVSTVKHEFFYGNLMEMPGNNRLHNRIRFFVESLFNTLLAGTAFSTSAESVKVATPDRDFLCYPDIVVTSEPETADVYVIQSPILIAEILSDSTRRHDMVDKFIQYQKIPSLQYYLLIEPEKPLVIFNQKNEDGDWMAHAFTAVTDRIKLPQLDLEISLSDIYGQ